MSTVRRSAVRLDTAFHVHLVVITSTYGVWCIIHSTHATYWLAVVTGQNIPCVARTMATSWRPEKFIVVCSGLIGLKPSGEGAQNTRNQRTPAPRRSVVGGTLAQCRRLMPPRT